MNIQPIDSLTALKEALTSSESKRTERFREQVMAPLKPIWDHSKRFLGLNEEPEDWAMTAAQRFMFFTPLQDRHKGLQALEWLEAERVWPRSLEALQRAVDALNPAAHGVQIPELNFAFVLANPEGMDARMDSYTGIGNVPGWVLLLAWPTEFNLPRLNAIVTHEFHHVVRFVFEPMFPNFTLGKYLVAEGLAEAFAASFDGEEKLGRWTTGLSAQALEAIKPRFREAINEPDFGIARAYIFGDWAAQQSGFTAQNIPDFAGYAMGYQMVKHYLDRTGQTIEQATYTPWQEIVAESQFFQ
jgi:uncharacterized protein YjaZ